MGKRHVESKYSEQLHRNVKMICRKQGRRLKDVEKAIGVSEGYFARNKIARGSTGIDIICALAELFNIPIEGLITDNYERGFQEMQAKAALTDAAAKLSEAIDEARGILKRDEIYQIIEDNCELFKIVLRLSHYHMPVTEGNGRPSSR